MAGKLPVAPRAFFDLVDDPREFNNLAEDPQYHGVMLKYAQKLLSLRLTHADRTLSNTLIDPSGVFVHAGGR